MHVSNRDGFARSLALAVGCSASYSLVLYALTRVHSLSHADDLIGALWAVIATVFVVRTTHEASVEAAKTRGAATAFSFVLCLAYLLFLPFHPWALAVLIGVGTVVLTAIGQSASSQVAGITTAVVMIAAAISPHEAWQQPVSRAADTAVGIAVGLAASWLASAAGRPRGTSIPCAPSALRGSRDADRTGAC